MFRTIIILISILLVLISQSCKQKIQPTTDIVNVDHKKTEINTNQEGQIQIIKDFYTAYILECDKPLPLDFEKIDSLKTKYFTKRLLDKLKEEDLDYDPILNTQDCDKKWIETLKIVPDINQKGIYTVSYTNGNDKEANQIRLAVTKIAERYLIDDIEIN